MTLPAAAAFAKLWSRVPPDDPRLDHLAAQLRMEAERELEEEATVAPADARHADALLGA